MQFKTLTEVSLKYNFTLIQNKNNITNLNVSLKNSYQSVYI